MEQWYQKSDIQIQRELHTSKNGLTLPEAAKILLEKGENKLEDTKKKGTLQVFLEQFKDLLVIILVIAAVISLYSGNKESTLVIGVVIILNAILGTVQHLKAEKSLDSLKAMSSPAAKVMRQGKKIEVDTKELVPGDLLLLEAGDLVAADGRILKNYSLQVNESSITGESTNVEKEDGNLVGELSLLDRTNMVYSGSLVTYGRADVIVTETGMNTEIGKIARLMNETEEKKTPLQISLEQFSGRLAIGVIGISILVFMLSLYRKMPIIDSLMFAVALAVAAIPEALGSIVTIVQAMGTQKMAKEHAVVKELKAVESLGSVSVICSDKTGTLTQNRMTVQEIYIDHKIFLPEELDLKNQLHRYLLYDAVLTNDSAIVTGKGMGDPTEYALLEMALKLSFDYVLIREMMNREGEIPFDSDRKLMSTLYRIHGVSTLLTKGAVDVLLERTTQIRMSDGVKTLTEADRKGILDQNHRFSEQGLRVLGFAYKEVKENHCLSLESEQDYVFLGLVSMMDPPREESKDAVRDAKRAGIRPVMITGDHKITATAIAKQIGIFEDGDMAVTGSQLDAMTDEELNDQIVKISVYARVSPENKIRIVKAWQHRGNVVSMTGDGVNDAPALKQADIGVAMGITGTEVSKDAAAMILMDDNFATIIKAVANGRNVYRNIKNAIQFLLSGNMAGILSVLYTSILGLPIPFAPVHLLFMNLLTDSLPAIAIGMEPADLDLLNSKPRKPSEGILTKNFMIHLLLQGGMIAAATMTAFYIGLNQGSNLLASTMAFATLTLARLFHGFNLRSSHSIFYLGFRNNWYSLGAFFTGALFLSLVLFVPFLKRLFLVSALTVNQTGAILILALIPTILIQGVKWFQENKKKS
ncbi:cation-translocating P-type ATPase [Clostridium sp. E02]|uniref:cation-translocating P-type ATPase n=1 Tax=Clostridium sp. E02 TaxID=2487134 RepID=UPI000F520876|nr:cation-translocating P-type ATPase [Clostridium sp. E02]